MDQPKKNIRHITWMEFFYKIRITIITIIKVAKVRVHIRRYVPHQRELKWKKEVLIKIDLRRLIKIIRKLRIK